MEDGLTGAHMATVVLVVAKDRDIKREHVHHLSHLEVALIVLDCP